jgi:alcohol dehydrogenase class IV
MSGFFTSPRIAWGPGAIEQLSGLGARRALLLADPAVAGGAGARRVREELTKSDTVVEEVEGPPEPTRWEAVRRLGLRVRETGVDWIVAMGGGSTIDGAKAARLVAERPEFDGSNAPPLLEVPDPPHIRVVAIPTTSGSGGESSWTADLWAPDGRAVELSYRSLVPEWALVDPEFARSLPAALRLDGAMEALGQGAEAYLSAWANPFSDALALDAVVTVLERLPHAMRWSDDPEAAAALHYAAPKAGLAASNSQRGVAHALARALQPSTGLPYGRLMGIVLPPVLEFDQPSSRDRLERLAAAAPAASEGPRTIVPIAERVRRIAELFRFPTSLRGAGVPPDRVVAERSAIVEDTLRSPGVLANPRVPSAAEVEKLLEAAMGP